MNEGSSDSVPMSPPPPPPVSAKPAEGTQEWLEDKMKNCPCGGCNVVMNMAADLRQQNRDAK
jgi:hypothetical protein